ncbi:MAG: hypothetical protein WCP55_10750, partial [Lentisphaerota bacterium]
KNSVWAYTLQDRRWTPVATTGKRIEPRMAINFLGYNADSTKVYLCGGWGNESGLQRDGWKTYVDMWEMDLRNFSFREISPIEDNTRLKNRLSDAAAGPDGKYCFSMYNFVNDNNVSASHFFSFDTVSNKATEVADSLNFVAWKLIYNTTTDKWYTIVSEYNPYH